MGGGEAGLTVNMCRQGREGSSETAQEERRRGVGEPGGERGRVIARCLKTGFKKKSSSNFNYFN